tara:strand:- start:1177 stop:1392 length:216 start_codon:yes stop_codon:yes gene_type:complete
VSTGGTYAKGSFSNVGGSIVKSRLVVSTVNVSGRMPGAVVTSVPGIGEDDPPLGTLCPLESVIVRDVIRFI